jgi:hypothetical protein
MIQLGARVQWRANDVLPQEVPYNWLWTKIDDDQVQLVLVKGVTW